LSSWSGALDHLRVAIQADPRNLGLRVRLGRTFSHLSRWAEAEDAFQAVLAQSPCDVEALIGLADAAKAQGDTQRALSLYRDAAAIAPLDLRPRREIRRLEIPDGADDWRREVNQAMDVATAAASAGSVSDSVPGQNQRNGLLVRMGPPIVDYATATRRAFAAQGSLDYFSVTTGKPCPASPVTRVRITVPLRSSG
jgi:tetratricopeptide (TPR) repeat protein